MYQLVDTIKDLKPKNSTGYDNISNKLIKNITSAVAEPMTLLINRSFSTGQVPKKYENCKNYSHLQIKRKNSF